MSGCPIARPLAPATPATTVLHLAAQQQAVAAATTPTLKAAPNPANFGFPNEVADALRQHKLLAKEDTQWTDGRVTILATSNTDQKGPAQRCLYCTEVDKEESKGVTTSKEQTTKVFFDKDDEWYLTTKDSSEVTVTVDPDQNASLDLLMEKIKFVVKASQIPMNGIQAMASGGALDLTGEQLPPKLRQFLSDNELQRSCYSWENDDQQGKYVKKVAAIVFKINSWKTEKLIHYTLEESVGSKKGTTSMKWFVDEGKVNKTHSSKTVKEQDNPKDTGSGVLGITTALEIIKKIPTGVVSSPK